MAIETADVPDDAGDYRQQKEECNGLYRAAIECLERGEDSLAWAKLQLARTIEAEGGDDQHAREAIAAVEGTLSPWEIK